MHYLLEIYNGAVLVNMYTEASLSNLKRRILQENVSLQGCTLKLYKDSELLGDTIIKLVGLHRI